MEAYVKTEHLAVGYDGQVLIENINIQIPKGSIVTLIGPNGAGKSTILKTITRQLEPVAGAVYVDGQDVRHWSPKEMARQVAVVLTDRIRPELMTCAELVAMGRYPYTNLFGRMTPADRQAVQEALERVHALDLADREFSTLSDGQRQRILLARAICQEPEILVLDEPTAYLDIRHKLELLDILREMAQTRGMTVILSLHEIDLAMKLSDLLLCVRDHTIAAFGSPEEVLSRYTIEQLYEMEKGSYNQLFGSVELTRPTGAPQVFVVAGGGCGIDCYRALQRQELPFATGILYDNDVDCQVAMALSSHVVTAPAFYPMTEQQYQQAAALLQQCHTVIDAGTPQGPWNEKNSQLLALAREKQIPVQTADQLLHAQRP